MPDVVKLHWDDLDTYDPAVHTDPAQPVRVELYCSCGAVFRQVDPVVYVQLMVTDWTAKHFGDGHGPVSPGEAIAEREARREAGLRAQGRAAEFEPREHPHLDLDSSHVPEWPVVEEPSSAEDEEG